MNEDEAFSYLDDLRESGVTNMWGAGEFIQAEFDCTEQEAKDMLIAWMTKPRDATVPVQGVSSEGDV